MDKENTRKILFFQYSEENLFEALEAVKNGMSRREASREYGIPRTTLLRKLSGSVPLKRKMGPATMLSEKEESVFVDWVLAMAKKGFPVSKETLILSVTNYLKASNRDVRFLNKDTLTPGRVWFELFLKRHPEIKQRYAENVSRARAAVTKDSIEKWFDDILEYLKSKHWEYILTKPERIFNADESGFSLCPSSGKVLGPAKSTEDFYQRVSNEKEQITVMAAFSADGKYPPPLIIFPYKKMPKAIVESTPENWSLGRSDSGWMNSEVFFEYISNHFLPYLKANNIQRPVLLFVDGHRSHLTLKISQFCDENGIVLIALYPNTTHITQPADVSVFRPLKAGWQSSVKIWKFQNFPKEVTRHTFGLIIKEVFEKYAKCSTIQNGFRKCGLYPFNKENVDYSKCIPNRPTARVLRDPHFAQSLSFPSKILECVEKKIHPEEIKQFQDCYESKIWKGNKESLNLFKVWCSLKDDSIKTDAHVTAEADIIQEVNDIEQDHINLGNISSNRNNDSIPSTSSNVEEWKTPEKQKNYYEQTENESKINILQDHNNVDNISNNTLTTKETEWISPEKTDTYTYKDKENEGFKVPSPFKNFLPFPKTPEKNPPKRKKTIFPAVVSSAAYRSYYEAEQKKKETPKPKKQKKVQGNNTQESTIQENAEKNTPKPKKVTPQNEDSSSEDSRISYADDDNDISDIEMDLKEGSYVIVKYDNKHYPGIIIKGDEEGAEISTMVSAGASGSYKWPNPVDILYYFKDDVICEIGKPTPKNNRGHFTVLEMKKFE